MATAAVNNALSNLASSTATPKAANEAGSAERFLKLLVTQMQNQDPLSPMDNAQITSQMAQINTVNGIEKLNGTVEGLNSNFVQMQAVSAAALVGHDVTVQGNRLAIANGVGVGGLELTSTASDVKVEVLSPAGRVVDTLDLGSLKAGRHSFNWPAGDTADGAPYRFKVVASNGSSVVPTTPLMRDRVQAVSTSGTGLVIGTQYSGNVAYSDVKAFN
jgi:flagellar basal-body rod modification protein FlgD